jgi:hypothetical protein
MAATAGSDEFWVGDDGARASRHAQAFSARLAWIGGRGVEGAETARRKDHRRGTEQNEPRMRSGAVASEEPDNAAILGRQLYGMKSLEEGD